MTEFLDDHPGGRDVIVANKSHDVTPLFAPRHPTNQLDGENLPPSVKKIGPLVGTEEELEEIKLKISAEQLAEEERIRTARAEFEAKGLGSVINMADFEKVAEPLLSSLAWAYYASAGDDEISECCGVDFGEERTGGPARSRDRSGRAVHWIHWMSSPKCHRSHPLTLSQQRSPTLLHTRRSSSARAFCERSPSATRAPNSWAAPRACQCSSRPQPWPSSATLWARSTSPAEQVPRVLSRL